MGNQFSENKAAKRFELNVEGQIAYANIRRDDSTMYVDYVFSPVELRGSGAAGELMQHVVEAAKQENLNIVPICGYAATWLRRNNKAS